MLLAECSTVNYPQPLRLSILLTQTTVNIEYL